MYNVTAYRNDGVTEQLSASRVAAYAGDDQTTPHIVVTDAHVFPLGPDAGQYKEVCWSLSGSNLLNGAYVNCATGQLVNWVKASQP